MRKIIKLLNIIPVILCILIGSMLATVPVSADEQVPKEGDTFYFAGKNWFIIHIDSGEYFLYAKDWAVGYNGFSHSTSSYTGAQGFGTSSPWSYIGPSDGSGIQDVTMNNWYRDNVSAADKKYVKPQTIYAEYYDLSGRSKNSEYAYTTSMYHRENNNAYTRYMYAISAEEYATYCQGLSWINSTIGNFRTGNGDILIWTRTGRKVDRSTPNRPVYISDSGDLNNINVVRPTDTTTYALISQKNHATNANTNYFSLTSTSGDNLNREFNIAGGTPAGVYDLIIQVTRNYNVGHISTMIDNGGCFDRVGTYRAALRLDRSKVDAAGIYYSGGAWRIGGGVTPSNPNVDSYQSGSKTYSTAAQKQAYTGANRTTKIYYTLTINKATNPMTINSTGSGTRVFSETAGTQTFNANPQSNKGAVTYAIKSQKTGSTTVSYFSIDNPSSPIFTVGAGTPVGTYTIEVNVTAAGDANYNPITKVFTYTLTVTKAPNTVKFDNQSGEVYFRMNPQSSPDVEPAYNNQGAITYSITAQKDSSNATVSYFSIPDTSSPNFNIAGGTPVGDYVLTMRATAAGNSNYNSGYAEMTYLLKVKQSSIPEITVNYYRANPNQASTTEGVYIETNRANAKLVDEPFLIDIHAQDKPFEVGSPVFGITKLYYQISTDGGVNYGPSKTLYDGPATLDLLKYDDIKISETPGIYYIKVTGINDVNNTGVLQDIYRIGTVPALFVQNQTYFVDEEVDIERIKEYASAYDSVDGDITSSIVVDYIMKEDGTKQDNFGPDWRLDTQEPTSYVISYSVTNSDGRTAMKTATADVILTLPSDGQKNAFGIYDRFIDQKYIDSLEKNSIWKSYDEYKDALAKAIAQSETPINGEPIKID